MHKTALASWKRSTSDSGTTSQHWKLNSWRDLMAARQ